MYDLLSRHDAETLAAASDLGLELWQLWQGTLKCLKKTQMINEATR